MEDSINYLRPVLNVILALGGLCALIAFVMAILRYFLYDNFKDDQLTLASRFIHICTFFGAIGLTLGGGSKLVEQLKQNTIAQEIESSQGASFVANGAKEWGGSYNNLGEALSNMKANDINVERDKTYSDTVANNTASANQKIQNGDVSGGIWDMFKNAAISGIGSGGSAI